MRQQIIITLILSVVLSIAATVKLLYFPEPKQQIAYFFLILFWICAVLIVIFMFNILWQFLHRHKPTPDIRPVMSWPNRRKSYRIIYPNYMRPTLIVDSADHQEKRQLEFPVLDLSQNGLCFIDDGSLGAIQSFSGRILFQDGEINSIKGLVIRNNKSQISVQLNQGIGWSTILKEQRQLMAQTKPARQIPGR
jgi:hypothetical protein